MTVPAATKVLVTTSGGLLTTSNAFTLSIVDVALFIDGALATSGGYQRTASDSGAGLQSPHIWSFSSYRTLTAGSHTFAIQARGNTNSDVNATVGGPVNNVLQGELNVVILAQ